MKLMATTLLLSLTVFGSAVGEERIAFANLDALLAYAAQAEGVDKQLEAYHQELAKGLETKQAYGQQKLTELREKEAAGIVSAEKLAAMRNELVDLEREMQESAVEADQKILLKRKELMGPIAEKLETTIREVARAEGFTYVLNSVDGAGTSIVLYGPDESNITEKVLTQMGLSLPGGGSSE